MCFLRKKVVGSQKWRRKNESEEHSFCFVFLAAKFRFIGA